MDKPKLALWFLLLVSLLLLPMGALAEQASPPSLTDEPSLSVELGYSGTVAYLRTMPLTVTINGGSVDIEGVVSVDINRDPERFDRYEVPVTVAARSTQRVVIPVKLMMRQPAFNVRLTTSGGEVIAESSVKPTRELGNNIVLVGTLSPDPSALSFMNMNISTDMAFSNELWTLISLNEQNFPSDVELLNSFNVVIVDGFDVRTLTESQQAALKTWINQGGIVILGGGASASTCYPFFEPMTGIKATGLVEAMDVPSALLAKIPRASALPGAAAENSTKLPAPEKLMLNTVSAKSAPLISGTNPILYQSPVDNGVVLTATFELGAKPLAQWNLMHSMWPSVIRIDQAVLTVYNNRVTLIQNTGYGYGEYDNLSSIATNQDIPIDRSAAPALVLLVAYLLLAGVISYFILKKMDKREWMWVTVPVLAIVFAFLVRTLGAKLQFDRPLAVTVAQINYDEEGNSSAKMSSAFSSSSMKPLTVSVDAGYTFEPNDPNGSYYDYYSPSQNQKQPTKLNYRYLFGDRRGIVLPNVESWVVYCLKFKQVPLEAGRITGRAWMEDDGIHAEILNESGQRLTQGAVIGSIGFNRMADIGPGETGTAFLKQTAESQKGFLAAPTASPPPQTDSSPLPTDAADTEEVSEETFEEESEETAEEEPSDEESGDEESGDEAADLATPTPDPVSYGVYGGSRLTTLPVDGEMRSVNTSNTYWDWDYLMAVSTPGLKLDPEKGLVHPDGSYPKENFLMSVYHEVDNYRNNMMGQGGDMPILNYIALADDMPMPNLFVDGQPIEQPVNRSFVNVNLSYEPIGPTGVVCYLPGMLMPQYVPGGFSGDPTQSKKEDEVYPTAFNTYYTLDRAIDFMFDLGIDQTIEVDLLEISAFSSEVVPKMSLYNLQTKTWDECPTLLRQLKGADADKYFAGGKLYVRITPDDEAVTLRDYMGSMPAPMMALKGRVK